MYILEAFASLPVLVQIVILAAVFLFMIAWGYVSTQRSDDTGK